MNKHALILLVLIICFSLTDVKAIQKNTSGPVIILPETKAAPIIDGAATDPCWKNAYELKPLMKFNSSGKPEAVAKPKTDVKLISGPKGIYIFAVFNENEMDSITVKEQLSKSKSFSSQIWLEDHWELFIEPLGNKSTIQLMGDPAGRGTLLNGKRETILTAPIATKKNTKSWTMEMLIPKAVLNVDMNDCPAFRFNFYRVRRANTVELSCWTPVIGRFSDQARFGWLVSRSVNKNIDWLRQRFYKPTQQLQLTEITKIFGNLKVQGQYKRDFDTVSEEIKTLQSPPAEISKKQWKEIATKCASLPERIRKLWEKAKLLEIIR